MIFHYVLCYQFNYKILKDTFKWRCISLLTSLWISLLFILPIGKIIIDSHYYFLGLPNRFPFPNKWPRGSWRCVNSGCVGYYFNGSSVWCEGRRAVVGHVCTMRLLKNLLCFVLLCMLRCNIPPLQPLHPLLDMLQT